MMEIEKTNAQVFIEPGAIYCSTGNTLDALWQALINARQNLTKLPCPAYEGWPWADVFLVEEPGATELGVDRKILRTMEKQAKLALYGAALAVQQVECIATKAIRSSQKGLYLALPTVDESVPPWSLLETLHEVSANPLQPEELSSSEFLQREIPAFFGLSTLNSNACAHISASFDLAGAMGAYSPFADAAFQALIDAAESIHQGENTVALVGGVSAKVNPQLLLQHEFWGWDKSPARIPAEASSFVVARANNIGVDNATIKPASVYLSGFARGFIGNSADKSKIYQHVLMQALNKANLSSADIDWFLPYATDDEDVSVLLSLGAKESLPVLTTETRIGFAGAAGPMINLNLALFGLQQQKYMYSVNASAGTSALDKIRIQEKAGVMRHVALSAAGPEGQYVVVILSREVV